MRRDRTPYASSHTGRVHVDGAVDVSTPVSGFYRFRLRSDGVRCGIRVWHGAPADPITGELLDRSPRWQCEVNGEFYDDFDRIWPGCAGEPISEAEYRTYCARQTWAGQHAPESAHAEAGRKVDRLSRSELLPF